MTSKAPPSIDPQLFRQVLGHLPTGACVVTTTVDDRPLGLSCNSFTSVSLSPPLVLFCPGRTSTTWPVMRPTGRFAVNVLGAGHAGVCRRFAEKDIDRFAGIAWRPSALGNPVLEDATAWLDCETTAEHDAGDHTIVVGQVHALEGRDAEGPLVFFRGRYGSFRSDG